MKRIGTMILLLLGAALLAAQSQPAATPKPKVQPTAVSSQPSAVPLQHQQPKAALPAQQPQQPAAEPLAPVRPALPAQQPEQPKAGPHPPVQPALPEVSELEKVKLENIQLKFTQLQQLERQMIEQEHPDAVEAEKRLQGQWKDLLLSIEKAHPGWVWNPTTNSLMKKPEK